MNPLKEKIRSGQPICGTHVQLTDPSTCTIFGAAGFDFLWVDMEHTYLSLKDVLIHLTAAKAAGVSVIVRVPQDDLTITKKVLEMGPDGIIFPMVRTAEQAGMLMSWTLYPPYGGRGFGPMGAVRYGWDDADEYVGPGHLDLCRFIQIEQKETVDNLPEIIKNPWIDGYIFGPNDLSGSVNLIHKVYEPEVRDLMERAISLLRTNRKYIGLSTGDTDPDVIRYWHDMGIQMISAGADNGYLLEGARKMRETLLHEHLERGSL